MNPAEITPELIQRHGLTPEEYQRLVALLGRVPNRVELGLFSVMWSEHCSYKSSKVHLRKFPTAGAHVIQGPGENAGVVDIGDGMVAAFKIESHNHPSYIEPYQGAATGVGGILRDIFTMGARPVALLDALRFGPLDQPKNRYLFEGVVAGIAGYGNCVGVPTVGGDTSFSEIYSRNPLVNVFCLGIARRDRIFTGRAEGVGNVVIYVGSKTGRDGIHGATMASESFGPGSEERRPTVQVGDPFTEKLLLEACLEIMDRDLIVGIQDMGAAGLTSSSVEMAGRAGTGLELDLTCVPLREDGMTPYEILLSESQERMVMVAQPDRVEAILEVCRRWELDAAVIGRVTDDGRLRVLWHGAVAAEVPISALTDQAPVYERPIAIPNYLDQIQAVNLEALPVPRDLNRVLLELLATPSIGSKDWIYSQYDHMVRTNTIVGPGAGAAVIRVKETGRALALTVDGNSLYCLLNPYRGGMITVCEAARNLAVVGARPIALTNCLNFGNPERSDVMWQLALCIEGMADACNALGIPVVSGNVSLYNETAGISIYPTPIVGMVGLIDRPETHVGPHFHRAGDLIVLIGRNREDLGGTEYLRVIHGREAGIPPLIELELERAVHRGCVESIAAGIISTAQDCAEGGLAVALAECCIGGLDGTGIGAEVELDLEGIRPDALLFGESQSRILVTIQEHYLDKLKAILDSCEAPMAVIGRTGGAHLRVALRADGAVRPGIEVAVAALAQSWRGALRQPLEGSAVVGDRAVGP